MASVRQLRLRIRSVKNTAKITKAMSMIAASKMRRAQEMALKGRPYSERMRELLADLAAQPREEGKVLHPLLQTRPIKNVAILHITPDRGLTGGMNTNVNKSGAQFILQQKQGNIGTEVIAVGKKGRDFMTRYGQNVKAVFTDLGEKPSITVVTPMVRILVDLYSAEKVDAVYLSYTDFVNTTVQRPVVVPLLPVVPAKLNTRDAAGYIYEPSAEYVLDKLLPRYVEMQVYHAILESVASEQSARMVAMRNATDNANDMIGELTIVMNKARQDSITKELLDIVGGAAAIQG